MKRLIVMIPAYNEEKTIESVLTRVPKDELKGFEINTLVIDDGSNDQTVTIAESMGSKVLSHPENLGLGIALKTGMKYALEQKADIVINIDADGQFDPREIPQLIEPIQSGAADLVIGNRFKKTKNGIQKPINMPTIKFIGNQIMTALINHLSKTNLDDVSSGFRAYSKEAILNLNLSGKYTVSHETIMDLAFKGLRIVSVPVEVKYFKDRKSKVAGNLLNYINQALKIITRAYRDYRPFQFFLFLGLPPMVIGVIALVFLLIHYIISGVFSPYKFIGFGGIYLFSLGLLLWIIGFLSDILVGIRNTQERQLYFQKKEHYEKQCD